MISIPYDKLPEFVDAASVNHCLFYSMDPYEKVHFKSGMTPENHVTKEGEEPALPEHFLERWKLHVPRVHAYLRDHYSFQVAIQNTPIPTL